MARPPADRRHDTGGAGRARRPGHAWGALGHVLGTGLALTGLLACTGGQASPSDPAAAAVVAPPAAAVQAASMPSPAPASPVSPASPAPLPGATPGPTPPADPVPPAAPATPAADALAPVRAELEATLARATQCRADADCRSVAIGAKACGGPDGYRAYSVTHADPAAVDALAARERTLAAQAARESGRVSTCLMLADPGARCSADVCVTGGRGARGQATR